MTTEFDKSSNPGTNTAAATIDAAPPSITVFVVSSFGVT